MKKAWIVILLFLVFNFIVRQNILAACCAGRGCNPNNVPPVLCAQWHCDTQADCDAKLGPAPNCFSTQGPQGCGSFIRCSSFNCCQTQNDCQLYLQQNPNIQSGGTGNSFDPGAGCGGISSGQVNTAIGCISTDPALFIEKFLKFGVGIAGGIAFLLILFGGFQIITSAGNPEQLNAGKELISSAIAGLLLIIFSILLLKIIGFNILGIPDFG